jgi:hypothetical protein
MLRGRAAREIGPLVSNSGQELVCGTAALGCGMVGTVSKITPAISFVALLILGSVVLRSKGDHRVPPAAYWFTGTASTAPARLLRSARSPWSCHCCRPRRTLGACARRCRSLVKRLGCNIGTVRPRHCASIQEEFTEVFRVLERVEHWTLQPRPEVDRSLGEVVEGEVDTKPATIVSSNNGW